MNFGEWLITHGIDQYLMGIFAKNFLTIGLIFSLLKIAARFIPGKADDEAIAAIERAISVFRRRKNGN